MDGIKIKSVFDDRMIITNKSLIDTACDDFRQVPRFVLDYLSATFITSDDDADGVKRISDFLRNHFANSNEREFIKYKIGELGRYSLFGRIQVRVDEARNIGTYWASISTLGTDKVRIAPEILEQYGQTLLVDGAWGLIDIVFDPSMYVSRTKIAPYLIVGFKPMQVTNVDVDYFIEKRKQFSKDEWIDLLITTIGFDPNKLDDQAKIVLLCRLMPFVENAINLVELGPKETGKTFNFKNLSDKSFVISGSSTTEAVLFYNKVRRLPGVVVTKDVVCFDEITSSEWKNQGEIINTLKDFMGSGSFTRGIELSSGCGVCFVGNIETDTQNKKVCGYHKHLFDNFPMQIRNDTAFLDRISGFIPGWFMFKITPEMFAKDYGFLSDYYSRILHRMREYNYSHIIDKYVNLTGCTSRSEKDVKRITSALLKLVFPHVTIDTVDKDDLKWCLDLAIDLRQRVIDQLAILESKEFGGIKLGYKWKKNHGT